MTADRSLYLTNIKDQWQRRIKDQTLFKKFQRCAVDHHNASHADQDAIVHDGSALSPAVGYLTFCDGLIWRK